jgi:hypothetical protein
VVVVLVMVSEGVNSMERDCASDPPPPHTHTNTRSYGHVHGHNIDWTRTHGCGRCKHMAGCSCASYTHGKMFMHVIHTVLDVVNTWQDVHARHTHMAGCSCTSYTHGKMFMHVIHTVLV